MLRGLFLTLRAAVAAALGLLVVSAPASAADFGTIEGQVVWGGKDLPKMEKIDSSKEPRCAAKGDLYNQDYVINPKNKGVRWCLVWLVDKDDYDKPIPISFKAKRVKKQVVIDQPHCMFEPRVVGLWAPTQTLLIKNSAEFPHNIHILGGTVGPELNRILPPGGEFELSDLKPRAIPISVTCDIHGWMKGKVGVFANPYFAVTDKDGKFKIENAPAGKYRLVIYQENGWVLPGGNPAKSKNGGKVIDIKANATTDLGKFECKPADND